MVSEGHGALYRLLIFSSEYFDVIVLLGQHSTDMHKRRVLFSGQTMLSKLLGNLRRIIAHYIPQYHGLTAVA